MCFMIVDDVGVWCKFGEEGELRRWGADLILKSTADLPALFDQETPLT